MLKIKWVWKAFKQSNERCVAGRSCEMGTSETRREEGQNAAAQSPGFMAGFGVPLWGPTATGTWLCARAVLL